MGLAYIGAIRALEFQYRRRRLSEVYRSFEGTSCGALCAVLLSLGFTSMEILLYYQQVPEFVPDFAGIPTGYGLGRVERLFGRVVEAIFRAAGIAEPELATLTFAQLHERTKVRTVIGMTIIGPEDRELDASHETVPDWPVLPCLYSSMAIPGVFEPVEIETPDGKVYAVDGALSNAFRYPGRPLGGETADEVLGILLVSRHNRQGFSPATHSMLSYFTLVCERFFGYMAAARSSELQDIVKIFCDSDVGLVGKPTQEAAQRLIRTGEKSCEEYFRAREEPGWGRGSDGNGVESVYRR